LLELLLKLVDLFGQLLYDGEVYLVFEVLFPELLVVVCGGVVFGND
jgi:hypothetical protein